MAGVRRDFGDFLVAQPLYFIKNYNSPVLYRQRLEGFVQFFPDFREHSRPAPAAVYAQLFDDFGGSHFLVGVSKLKNLRMRERFKKVMPMLTAIL